THLAVIFADRLVGLLIVGPDLAVDLVDGLPLLLLRLTDHAVPLRRRYASRHVLPFLLTGPPVSHDSAFRKDFKTASASSIFFSISALPFSSWRPVHSTFFIASTAISSSPDKLPLDFFWAGPTRSMAESRSP